MEIVIVFGLFLAYLFYLSTKRGEIQEPLAQHEKVSAGWGVPLTIMILIILVVLLMGLMGSSLDGSAYAIVEENGTRELLDFFIFSSIIGCVGLLMIINGIARGLGVILLIIGILGSVGVTELVR